MKPKNKTVLPKSVHNNTVSVTVFPGKSSVSSGTKHFRAISFAWISANISTCAIKNCNDNIFFSRAFAYKLSFTYNKTANLSIAFEFSRLGLVVETKAIWLCSPSGQAEMNSFPFIVRRGSRFSALSHKLWTYLNFNGILYRASVTDSWTKVVLVAG